MPSTRSSSDGVLQPMIDNINRLVPPVTPGTKVRQLEDKLNKRDAENQALKTNLDDLTKAFGTLEMVKETVIAAPNTKDEKKPKKDKNAPAPYKTAYKFYCDDVPAHVAPKERQLAWKQCPPLYRAKYESYAHADKVRFDREMAAYQEEQLGLGLLREKKQHQEAMEVYNAHIAAQQRLVQAEQEKKGKKKTPKDEDAPKRPLSSYMYFAQEKRASVSARNPKAPVTEISKILGTMWSKLDKSKSGARGAKKYEDMAATDRARYQEEKVKYDAIVAERNARAEQERLVRLEQEKQEARALLHNMRNVNTFMSNQNADMVASLDGASVVSDFSGSQQDSKPKKDPNAPKRPKSAYNCFVSRHFAFAKSQMPENSSSNDVFAFLADNWPHLPADERAGFEQMAATDRERYNWEMAQYTAQKQQGYF
jgi:upstream-binding transcription factor